MKRLLLFSLYVTLAASSASAQQIISEKNTPGSVGLVLGNAVASIYADDADFETVNKTVSLFQQDIEMVTGKKPAIINKISGKEKNIIIIGTIGKSALIGQLIKEKKLDVSGITGKWEAYQIQTIAHPFKAVENALVVTGSDSRGVAYGVFELSKQIGVSPWYWWADVPVKKKTSLYVKQTKAMSDAPKVKYRGIFINDEAPALSGWSKEKFGGFNSKFYAKVFELILRLKGNYLWPAMWGNAFYDD
ncbi:MAG TPA: glycosyl hydrolase 115 family protein, partial [Chitinophagaceae bacterium]|nr:glycosyl hydrolase 115 family protein [Chitinophagaceae bacterium]